jgi:hypothetical protein
MTSARCVNTQNLRALFVTRAQHLASLRVHQMRLSAREARHLNVSEVIVFGVIGDPTLDIVVCVGTAVEERRHDLAFVSSGCGIVSVGTGLR